MVINSEFSWRPFKNFECIPWNIFLYQALRFFWWLNFHVKVSRFDILLVFEIWYSANLVHIFNKIVRKIFKEWIMEYFFLWCSELIPFSLQSLVEPTEGSRHAKCVIHQNQKGNIKIVCNLKVSLEEIVHPKVLLEVNFGNPVT